MSAGPGRDADEGAMGTGADALAALKRLARGRWRLATPAAMSKRAGEPVRLEGEGGARLELAPATFARLVEGGFVRQNEASIAVTPTGRARLRRALLARQEPGRPDAPGTTVRPSDRPMSGDEQVPGGRTSARGEAGRRRAARTSNGQGREGPLGWLAGRRDRDGRPLIAPVELAAGERLAADFERAQLRQRVTANWDPTAAARRTRGGRRQAEPSDVALDARRRLQGALDAVGGDLAKVLWWVCCEEVRLEELERRQGWPKRCGKVVLSIALRRLASHYGMSEEARGADRPAKGGIRHWGAEDYRPRIDGLSGAAG